MNRTERITSILTQNFHPSHLEVRDDSHKHAGHAGTHPEGESHLEVIIKSDYFNEMTRIERHQAIYRLLAEEFKTGLHALSIQVLGEKEYFNLLQQNNPPPGT